MAVQYLGPQRWLSTLIGKTFDSEEAAQHYDNRQALHLRAETEGEKILAGLSTEQLRSLAETMDAARDTLRNQPNEQEEFERFCRSHPNVATEGQNGVINFARMGEWLRRVPVRVRPYSAEELTMAYDALAAEGEIFMKRPDQRSTKEFDEDAASQLSTEELLKRGGAVPTDEMLRYTRRR